MELAQSLTLRDLDPRVDELLADGWQVVAESWGARLRVTKGTAPRCRDLVARATSAGWSVRPLRDADADADAVVALDTDALADYPDIPQSRHEVPRSAALAAALGAGRRWVWGAFAADGELQAATVLRPLPDRVETEFTVVAAAARRRGLASAVKAAAVLALAERGHVLFGTGGASVNEASRRANEAVGYEITERWLRLTRP